MEWIKVIDELPPDRLVVLFYMGWDDQYELGHVENGLIILRSVWSTRPTKWIRIHSPGELKDGNKDYNNGKEII